MHNLDCWSQGDGVMSYGLKEKAATCMWLVDW